MSERVNLCAKIPKELHCKIKEGQLESGLTLNGYMEYFILNYFEMETRIERNEVNNMATTRTLAIQIDDELFERINVYIKQKGLKKREFLLNLIETALAEDEGTTEQVESTNESEDTTDDEVESTDESEDTSDDEVESTDENEDTTDGEVESTEDEAQGNDNTLRAMFRNY